MYSGTRLIRESETVPSLHQVVERAFTVVSLLLYSGALTCFIAPNNPVNIIVQFISFTIAAITAILLLKRWKKVVYCLFAERFILIITMMTAISVLWSVLPVPDTLYRSATFMGTGILPFLQITLFSIYFATQYSLSGQLRLLALMLGAAAALSVVVALLLPHYGVMGGMETLEDARHVGSWRGVYVHKNILGNTMTVAGILFLALSNDDRRYRLLLRLGLILAIGLLVLSTSRTALVVLLILIVLLPLYKVLRLHGMVLIPSMILTFVFTGTMAVLMITNLEVILGALGRDLTFTGRSVIWSAISNNIENHFWLGHGYKTFWFAVKSKLIIVATSSTNALTPTSAHNGFLDLFIDLGLIGFSLFIFSLFVNYIRAIRLVRITKRNDGVLPLLILTCMTQINVSESYLLGENLLWLLYVSISIGMVNQLRELSKYPEQLEAS